MYRGQTQFVCRACGMRFEAPDIEWNATIMSMPVPCPRCGNMTNEHSYMPLPLWRWICKLIHK
jgi:DNA-directed RNA polymerase subunit RPC12/RpoP